MFATRVCTIVSGLSDANPMQGCFIFEEFSLVKFDIGRVAVGARAQRGISPFQNKRFLACLRSIVRIVQVSAQWVQLITPSSPQRSALPRSPSSWPAKAGHPRLLAVEGLRALCSQLQDWNTSAWCGRPPQFSPDTDPGRP